MLEKGEAGQVYNVGGPDEKTNIEVVKTILELTGQDESLISHVEDRLGHDLRYSPRLGEDQRLGWKAQVGFDEGIERTVNWYRDNPEWWGPLRSGEYREYYEKQYGTKLAADGRPPRNETRRPGPDRADVHGDERGFFVETFSADAWEEFGVDAEFVQQNHSRSDPKGTLRGIHFQTSPGQAKLVRCPRGAIFDVAVDLRQGSPTYGQWEGYILDDTSHRQLFVPVGFGHGFEVLSDVADVTYKVTSLYDPATESQLAWDDPDVGIEWPIAEPVLSARDTGAPTLAEIGEGLPFTV